MSNDPLFPHGFPKFLASHVLLGFTLMLLWQKHGCSAAPCSSGEQKPWKLQAAGVVSKLMNVALNKSVKMSVHYALGTIRDWQAVGKPTWLISEINSSFLKTTLLF